jgi:hypothetical protein
MDSEAWNRFEKMASQYPADARDRLLQHYLAGLMMGRIQVRFEAEVFRLYRELLASGERQVTQSWRPTMRAWW